MVAGREASPSDVAATARIKNYWSHGAGREKWIHSPTPYRTLRALLEKYVTPAVAAGLAANIFHDALGYWPGDQKGKNPVGPG